MAFQELGRSTGGDLGAGGGLPGQTKKIALNRESLPDPLVWLVGAFASPFHSPPRSQSLVSSYFLQAGQVQALKDLMFY